MELLKLLLWVGAGLPALGVLYLLMIMPRLRAGARLLPFRGVLYAHRGLHDNRTNAPENSLAAFARAVEAGYGMEMDVQVTRDRIPVVFHDFTLKRMCGKPGKVCDYTYEELSGFTLLDSGERIPALREVLELVDGKAPLIIELKIELTDMTVCEEADKLLQQYPGLYCIESFNPLALWWYRRNRKNVVRGQLSDGFLKSGEYKGFQYVCLENLCGNFLTKPDFVAFNHKYHDLPARTLCRNLFKNPAVAYTIKSQKELEEAKRHFDIFIFDSFIPKH